jgi:hypothetical protein
MNTAVERLEQAIENLQNGTSPLNTYEPDEGAEAEEWALLMAASRFSALRRGSCEPAEEFKAGLRHKMLAAARAV